MKREMTQSEVTIYNDMSQLAWEAKQAFQTATDKMNEINNQMLPKTEARNKQAARDLLKTARNSVMPADQLARFFAREAAAGERGYD